MNQVTEVLTQNGACKEWRVLSHNPDPPPQVRQVKCTQVPAVEQD